MNQPVDIPARFGFNDLRGFVDYFALVTTLDAGFFVPEDFVPSELQWSLDDVFRGLALGYQLISLKTGDTPLLVECRRLTSEARSLIDEGRFDEPSKA